MRSSDLDALRLFLEDFPQAKAWLLHTGTERRHVAGIEIAPFEEGLAALAS